MIFMESRENEKRFLTCCDTDYEEKFQWISLEQSDLMVYKDFLEAYKKGMYQSITFIKHCQDVIYMGGFYISYSKKLKETNYSNKATIRMWNQHLENNEKYFCSIPYRIDYNALSKVIGRGNIKNEIFIDMYTPSSTEYVLINNGNMLMNIEKAGSLYSRKIIIWRK